MAWGNRAQNQTVMLMGKVLAHPGVGKPSVNRYKASCFWFGSLLVLRIPIPLTCPPPPHGSNLSLLHVTASGRLSWAQSVRPVFLIAGWTFCSELLRKSDVPPQPWKICGSSSVNLALRSFPSSHSFFPPAPHFYRVASNQSDEERNLSV